MNKNYPCDIIQDLLPGYIDGMLSETGLHAVKTHLDSCDSCRQTYLEMKEALDPAFSSEEQPALDGFKKIRRRTRNLKVAVGIVSSLLILILLSIFLKLFIIGEPLPTHHIAAADFSYEEETGNLLITGRIDLKGYRVSRVIREESKDDANAVNIIVYGAYTLPFHHAKQDFTITVPDMKGKTAYFACPDYDRQELYSWRHSHRDELLEMEEEIYSQFSGLDRKKDVLTCLDGIESVDGTDGILFSVDTVTGEDAAFWKTEDQLITDGTLEPKDFEIWISLEKPHKILIYDLSTGNYTEDDSVID